MTIGMAVLPGGELHLSVNGNDIETRSKHLPTNQPLYGVVGLGNPTHSDNEGSFKLGKTP